MRGLLGAGLAVVALSSGAVPPRDPGAVCAGGPGNEAPPGASLLQVASKRQRAGPSGAGSSIAPLRESGHNDVKGAGAFHEDHLEGVREQVPPRHTAQLAGGLPDGSQSAQPGHLPTLGRGAQGHRSWLLLGLVVAGALVVCVACYVVARLARLAARPVPAVRRWWSHRMTARFKFAMQYSTRVTAWVALGAVVPLCFPRGHRFLADHSVNIACVVCNVLFTIGPNVGATVQNIINGFVGICSAGLALYAQNCCFPAGYTGHDVAPFWVGTTCSMLFVTAFMILDVKQTMRFYALWSYVYFAMAFLDPRRGTEAKTLQLDLHLFLFLSGAGLSISCSLLPFPVTALGTLRGSVSDLGKEVMVLKRDLLRYYCGSAPTMDVYELKSKIQAIGAALQCTEGAIGAAWYECFGLGSAGVSCRLVGQLVQMIRDILLALDPLVEVGGRGRFDEGHRRILDALRQPLFSAADKIEALTEACTRATMGWDCAEVSGHSWHGLQGVGQGSRREDIDVQRKVAELRAAVADVSIAAGLTSSRMVLAETTGIQHFVYTTRVIACLVIERADALFSSKAESLPACSLLSRNLSLTGSWGAASASTSESTVRRVATCLHLDKDHLRWAIRNGLSLLLCFWIGFFGWGPGCRDRSKLIDATCFIKPYNANLASLVVMLHSKSVGSTLRAGLSRASVVALVTSVGHAGYVLFGWCSISGRAMTGAMIFVLVQPTLYLAYSRAEFAELGARLGALGVMAILRPCSDSNISRREYSHEYHEISDIIVGVLVMLLVDLCFGGKRATSVAKDNMCSAMAEYGEAFGDYLTCSEAPQPLPDRLVSIQDKIDVASSLAGECLAEPRLWRPAWRPTLFAELVSSFTHLCRQLGNLGRAAGDDRAALELLSSLPAFQRIRADLVQAVGRTVELGTFVLRHQPDVPCELAKTMHRMPGGNLILQLDQLIKEINAHPSMAAEVKPTLPSNNVQSPLPMPMGQELGTQLAVVIETLHSIAHQLQITQHRIIADKHL